MVSNTRQDTGELHIQVLEGPGKNPAGEAFPPALVPKLWHAYANIVTGPAPIESQVKLINRDETEVARCGYVLKGRRDVFKFVSKGG